MSSESRIWEIRPFASMRGGSALVIGPGPFNPAAPAYSTEQRPGISSWVSYACSGGTSLTDARQGVQSKFLDQTRLIDRFDQPRSFVTMDLNRRSDDCFD